MPDPRVGWGLSLAVMLLGFLLAAPAEGWLEVLGGLLLVGGLLASSIFLLLNRRALPPEKRRGPWWWSDWNER